MPAAPASSTCAYRLKALHLCVQALTGTDGAARFLLEAQLPGPFEDETRPICRRLWVDALPAFERICGSAGFAALPRYIVHPKNLAFWSPLLREAAHPRAVYAHLAASSSDLEQLSEWREEERGPRSSRLSTLLPETEPRLQRLVVEALTAELAAVPLLFGRRAAAVRGADILDGRLYLRAHFGAPPRSFGSLGFVGTALGGGSGLALGLMTQVPALESSLLALTGSGLAAGVAWALGRDAAFRSANTFQRTRILALEREASVRREQRRTASVFQKESLIAGQYRIGEQLGVGGASAVWEAHRVSDGQPVAIKLLRTSTASEGRASDRLQREAEALGLTWHPHVVKVHDHGLLPSGLGYLVMERLRGETLSARVRRLRALPEEEVIRFGVQAAEALFAVHQAGIVHRDVKPSNLFLHHDSSGELLKLFDFGVAHVNWAETRLTRDGAAIGTPGYAAPEQDDGDPAHPSADIFSLGVSLLEMLDGEAPTSSSGSARRLRASRRADATRERRSADPLSSLRKLLAEMTALDPADRPPDCRDIAIRLRRISADSLNQDAVSERANGPEDDSSDDEGEQDAFEAALDGESLAPGSSSSEDRTASITASLTARRHPARAEDESAEDESPLAVNAGDVELSPSSGPMPAGVGQAALGGEPDPTQGDAGPPGRARTGSDHP